MRKEEAAGATSDLPPRQNSRPKAAGGCQATLSLSQREAESHKKNKTKKTLITLSSAVSRKKSPGAAPAAAGQQHPCLFPVVPVGSSYLPAITLPAAWDCCCRPPASRCVCTTNENHCLGCSIFGLQPASSIFEWSQQHFFSYIIFMRGKTFAGCGLGEFIWLRISLKTNPEGCLPPAQPAFNLFLSPAKACPFKVPAVLSASRSLQSPKTGTKKDQIGLNFKCLSHN